MPFSFKQAIAALSLGAMALTGIAATPAFAQPGQNNREWREDRRENRQDRREDRRDVRQDRRDDRRDWRQANRNDARRPGRPINNYDWNRPDPRYGRSYQPSRYYRSGYDPIRVDRRTRIAFGPWMIAGAVLGILVA